jgi:hypothetical protein
MTTKLVVAASDETLGAAGGMKDESDSVDTLVAIVESTPERLNFWYAVAPGSPVRIYGPLFLLSFSAIWLGFVGYAAWSALGGPFAFSKIFEGLFFLGFGAVGLAIVALALYIAFGRTTIDLTREQLACRWNIGPFSYTRRLPTDSVDSVRVVRTQNSTRDGRVKNKRTANSSGSGPYTTCVAFAGIRKLPLTFLNDEPLARQVASLVNNQLHEMGYRLTDA